ncbi:non-homologous end-joining factor 1-like [Saccostrea echinata]|uniref:non-homologous end-joining factor 1-like n=1 Tax=Saccostrea echinata TaxID=191078 RepID=UPI002A7FD422|nr:non-homologous end-joining factor 1-like [Saccostrea echinata]
MSEVEWRRKWKPDLKACPWQPITIASQQYLFKCMYTHSSYELLFTDNVKFWFEQLEGDDLEERTVALNPSVKATPTRILDEIQNCLEKPSKKTNLSASRKKNKFVINVDSQLAGMAFVWQFRCEEADSSMISENFNVPLLAMVAELTRRNKELIKIIEAKDKEIDDYKSQGAKTSRKHIETAMFVTTAFENDMIMSRDFEEEVKRLGSSGFSEDNQDLYRQIMTRYAYLTRPVAAEETTDESVDDKKTPSVNSWEINRLPASLADRSPVKSVNNSPQKSPAKSSSSEEPSPVKDSELLRRQALERKLEDEERKKNEPKKKKKKIAF